MIRGLQAAAGASTPWYEVKPRRRHKGGKLAEKFKRFEADVGGSVAPAALQATEQPTVGQKRHALRDSDPPSRI